MAVTNVSLYTTADAIAMMVPVAITVIEQIACARLSYSGISK
jgi:hypothetical protein